MLFYSRYTMANYMEFYIPFIDLSDHGLWLWKGKVVYTSEEPGKLDCQ